MSTQIRGLKFWKWDDELDGFLVKGSPFVFRFKHISEAFKARVKKTPLDRFLVLSVYKDSDGKTMWVNHYAEDQYKAQARAKNRRAKAWQEYATLQAEGGASVGLSTNNRPGGMQTGGAASAGGGIGQKRSDKILTQDRKSKKPRKARALGEDI